MAANKPLCAGELTERITIQELSPTATVDAGGEVDRTDASNWTAFDGIEGKRWAKRHAQGGREFYRGRQLYPTAEYLWEVRRDTKTLTINAQHRLLYRDVVHEIIAMYEGDGDRSVFIVSRRAN